MQRYRVFIDDIGGEIVAPDANYATDCSTIGQRISARKTKGGSGLPTTVTATASSVLFSRTMKAADVPWPVYLIIAASCGVGGIFLIAEADYAPTPGGVVGLILLVIGGLSAIVGLLRFVKWAWKD